MSVFEEACYLSNQRWVASLPTEFEVYEFSKRHQKRMKTLFDKMRRDKYHRFTKRATIALIAAIIVISLTVTAFAIPATRDFIIQRFFDHSQYTVVGGEQNVVGDIVIGYIPEGFEKTYGYNGGYETTLNYQTANNDSWFNVRKASLNQTAAFDTEKYPHEKIVYNNTAYIYYYSGNNFGGCVWNSNEFVYDVSGNLPKEELLKIAFSVTE